MREFVTCQTCGSYIQLEDLRAPCQLCGADMCVRCAKECQECGKEICRNCYRGKGLCRTCSPMAYAKNAWNQIDHDDGVSQAGGLIKALGGLVYTAHEREKLGEERRENERQRRRLMQVQEYKDAVYRYIRNHAMVNASAIAEEFKLSEQTVYLILDELAYEGKISDA